LAAIGCFFLWKYVALPELDSLKGLPQFKREHIYLKKDIKVIFTLKIPKPINTFHPTEIALDELSERIWEARELRVVDMDQQHFIINNSEYLLVNENYGKYFISMAEYEDGKITYDLRLRAANAFVLIFGFSIIILLVLFVTLSRHYSYKNPS